MSKATVSMALRGDKRIHADTRKLIHATAKRLGYQPNPAMTKLMANVKAMRKPAHQGAIGMIFVDPQPIVHHRVTTYHEWVQGAKQQAAKRGYSMDEFWVHEPGMTTDRLISVLKARGIEGLLVPATSGYDSLPEKFSDVWQRFACVVMGIRNRNPVMNFAANDQYMTIMDATKRVHSLGYGRIGLAILEKVNELVDARFASGFETARELLNLSRDIPVLIYNGFDQQHHLIGDWYKQHQPDAVICIDHRIKNVLNAAGADIPAKTGLVHLDWHNDMPDWCGMNQHNERVGEAAVELLIQQINFDQSGPPDIPVSTLVTSTWQDGPSLIDQRIHVVTRSNVLAS